jgi:DNA polymerase-3 subunit delta
VTPPKDRDAATARILKNGEAPVYLLHGEATFLTRRAFDWLRPKVTAGFPEDFNLDRFDARDKLPLDRIVDAARTLPMMAPRRLVWVKNAEALFTGQSGNNPALLRYLEAPDATTCLAFVANDVVDRRGKLYKALEKVAVVFEARTPPERELVAWITAQAHERGRTILPDGAHLLADAVGRDLAALDAALERLCLFVEGPAPIELAHVEQVVPHTRSHSVWELADAVADRNLGAALSHAHELLGQGEPALKILGLIADRVRRLILGRTARAGGATVQEAAQAAGIPPFKASDFGRQMQRYKGAELLGALERLAAADWQLKRSKLDDELLLESLLMDLCAGEPEKADRF